MKFVEIAGRGNFDVCDLRLSKADNYAAEFNWRLHVSPSGNHFGAIAASAAGRNEKDFSGWKLRGDTNARMSIQQSRLH
jgi:hypothetical protein